MLTSLSSIVRYGVPLAPIVVIAVICAGVLSRRLLGGSPPRMPVDRVLDGGVSPDAFARAALANRISPEPLSRERLAQLRAAPGELASAIRALRAADARFDYLRRHMAIYVSSIWNLMRLTLLVAALITASGFLPMWRGLTYGTWSGPVTFESLYPAIFETGVWALSQLAFGFSVAAVMCIVAMVFDAMLQRRLASWKYVYSTVRDALSDGQTPSSSAE